MLCLQNHLVKTIFSSLTGTAFIKKIENCQMRHTVISQIIRDYFQNTRDRYNSLSIYILKLEIYFFLCCNREIQIKDSLSSGQCKILTKYLLPFPSIFLTRTHMNTARLDSGENKLTFWTTHFKRNKITMKRGEVIWMLWENHDTHYIGNLDPIFTLLSL